METTLHTKLLRIIVRLKLDVATGASDIFFKCKHHRHQWEQMEYKNTNYYKSQYFSVTKTDILLH